MRHAQLPDGTTLEFPDDTPDAAMDKAVKAHVSGQPTAVGSLLRGVVQGATFGFGDELRAGTDALVQGAGNLIHGSEGRPTMGQAYDTSLAKSREDLRRDYETNPVSTVGGQVVGGVGGAVLGGAGAAATGVAARLAPVVAPVVARLPGVVQTGLRYAGGGAAAGGVAGFGEGEGGLTNRLASGGTGAVTGAVVAPVLGAAASSVRPVVGRIGTTLGLGDPGAAAERQVARSLDRGGVSVDEASARLAAAGDQPVALVDVGGRNTVNLGASVANTPSTAMDVADRFVQSRRAGRPDRLMTAGDQAFGGGSGDDIAQITAARHAQRTAEAGPLYQAALGKPAGFTEPMAAVLEDPIAQQGLRRGLEIQRIENTARRARGEAEVPTTDPSIQYDEHGTPRIVGVPNMRSLDAVKRGMDAIIEDARSDTTGKVKWDERLHAIDDLRRTWVGLLDQGNPDYAAARAAWGGPSAQMEATQAGRTAFRTDRDVVAGRMRDSPPDVADAYRLGAGRDFGDRASNPARDVNFARTMLEDAQMQARLRSLLSPEDFAKLNATLQRETQMGAVEQAVSPRAGSQTARLQAGGADLGRDPLGPWGTALNQLLTGRYLSAAGTVSGEAARRIGQGRTATIADEMANRLFTTDPAGRQRVTDALRARLAQDELARQRASQVLRPVARGLSTAVGGMAGSP